MAVCIRDRKTGKCRTLLNPAEKGRKFSAELKFGIHSTNDHQIKRNRKGKAMRLTDTQKAYRSGYLAARKDSANCFKSKNKKNGSVIIYQG